MKLITNKKSCKTNRKIHSLLFLAAFCIFFARESKAKIALCLFEEKVILSDFIVVGKVVDLGKSISGGEIASVEIVQTIKGALERDLIEIEFGKNPSRNVVNEDITEFIVGESYVLFLRRNDPVFTLFCQFQGSYRIKEGGFVCFRNKNISTIDFIKEINQALEDELNHEWLRP